MGFSRGEARLPRGWGGGKVSGMRMAWLMMTVVLGGCDCSGDGAADACETSTDCPAGRICVDGTCAAARDGGPGADGGQDAGLDAAACADGVACGARCCGA